MPTCRMNMDPGISIMFAVRATPVPMGRIVSSLQGETHFSSNIEFVYTFLIKAIFNWNLDDSLLFDLEGQFQSVQNETKLINCRKSAKKRLSSIKEEIIEQSRLLLIKKNV